MRQRLMEATVESLVELGWAGTTTTEVSQRAGVSRGAQLHHFPSKQDLVVAAIEHLAVLRGKELEALAANMPTVGRTRAVLDVLAAMFTGPLFFAALELWTAARTDRELLEALAPLERRIGRDTHSYAVAMLGVNEEVGDNRSLIQATLDLLRGLGLAMTLSDDTVRRNRLLDSWAEVLDAQIQTVDDTNSKGSA